MAASDGGYAVVRQQSVRGLAASPFEIAYLIRLDEKPSVAPAKRRVAATGYLATNTGRSARLTTSADTDRENKRDSQLR